jgi:uncharacterized membrane protein
MKIYAQSPLEQKLGEIGNPPGIKSDLTTAGGISYLFSKTLQYSLIIAGLVLLAMIISAGFTLLTSAGDPKKVESGWSRLTHAAIGFLIVFAAYWIAQILQVVFNLPILKG